VCRYNQRWSLESQNIPRTLFKHLKQPLVWARFIKDDRRQMVGFLFYEEADDVARLPEKYRTLFIEQDNAPLWPRVVEEALVDLGGEGDLSDIYQVVEGRKPTNNKHWRPQIRKVLQSYFHRVSRSRYSLALQ
jgi:site-specific DNA-methyltransferase (adenine-specific)